MQINWGEMLHIAQNRPGIYIGSPESAHWEALKSAIDFVAVARPFVDPIAVSILCSPTQYLVRWRTGPLVKRIERSVDWQADRMLIDTLADPYFYRSDHSCTLQATPPVPLAERFFVGIKSKSGFRYQTYRQGWPTTDVLVHEKNISYSFVVAAQLTSQWFTGLPFRYKDMRSMVKAYRSLSIHWEMRSSDDILPQNLDDMIAL